MTENSSADRTRLPAAGAPGDVIPLVDLKAQYAAHKDELDSALADVIARTGFVGGAGHAAFEAEFAEFCGGGHAAACGNGTDALTLAIVELLGRGDGTGEIIMPSHTFIATAEAISNAGYQPVFAEIDANTYVIDSTAMASKITLRTKAVIPVHIYGQMAPMDKIMAIAEDRGLIVIEDAAQAHGATWKRKGPGQLSHAACFSFYPGKNLGAWGDGGAVFARDGELIAGIRKRTNHGRATKYSHDFIGTNSRLDSLQAEILRVKLAHLLDWNEKRRQIAARYNDLLSGLKGVVPPVIDPDALHVFHLYVIQLENRDAVLKALSDRGIGAGVHYPVPVHRQPAYAHLGTPVTDFPITNRVAERVLSLPIFPEMTFTQVERVVSTLRAVI
jgi:dTDP-4-amino-4,6-dideoxygalactose transaminase